MSHLNVGDTVKLMPHADEMGIQDLTAAMNEVGRVVGFAGGDYQIKFPSLKEPLWFARDEIKPVSKVSSK